MGLKLRKTVVYPLLAVLSLLVLFLGACAGVNNSEPPSDEIEIRLAPIHEVDIRIAESYPPQVFVHIQGGLSDGCTTFHELKEERTGKTINIEVTTQRPKDAVCTAVYSYFEKNVGLGSDFTSGETYTVKVNDYSTSFTMQ